MTPQPFYPRYAIQQLINLHAARWAEIVHHVSNLPLSDPAVMAFTLTVRRLGRRLDYRYQHHLCAACAQDILAGYPGDEHDLVTLYYVHLEEINKTMQHMQQRQRARQQAA